MTSKVVLLFCCLAAGTLWEQASPTKRLYGPGPYVSHAGHCTYHKQETPQYDFTYGVSDLSYGGASYGASESRRGARTKGSYFVDIPGSQSQRVSYAVGGDASDKPNVSYQQKYLPKLEKVGYEARNVYIPGGKEFSYKTSVIKHPSPSTFSPKREIFHHSFPVSHSSIRNFHKKSHPTSFSKSNFFYPKNTVSNSKSKIYHHKPSYTAIYKAHPIELKGNSQESDLKEEDSDKKGVVISKLPSTKVTYQPRLIKTYKPVYEVKYKPVFKREHHH